MFRKKTPAVITATTPIRPAYSIVGEYESRVSQMFAGWNGFPRPGTTIVDGPTANGPTVAVAEQTEVAVPVGVTPEVELSELEEEEYAKVSRQLGMYVGSQAEQELLLWLKQRGEKVYDYEQVAAFLQSKCPAGKTWNWFCLRPQDNRTDIPQRMLDPYGRLFDHVIGYGMGIYGKKLPLPILSLARDLEQAFPSTFTHHVSDYEVPRPDPFLMVMARIKPSRQLIIAHWDEPAFVPSRAAEKG